MSILKRITKGIISGFVLLNVNLVPTWIRRLAIGFSFGHGCFVTNSFPLDDEKRGIGLDLLLDSATLDVYALNEKALVDEPLDHSCDVPAHYLWPRFLRLLPGGVALLVQCHVLLYCCSVQGGAHCKVLKTVPRFASFSSSLPCREMSILFRELC